MNRNLIYLLYGIPSVGVYLLTVASICFPRTKLSQTFVVIFILTAVTNLITYLNTWIAIRLQTEQWFFGYYEFINHVSVISYIHQFFIGFLYFAQNVNAFLLTLDRFFAIAGMQWKEKWNRYYKLFTLLCHTFCGLLYYFTAGFHYQNRENVFVHDAKTNSYSMVIKDRSSSSLSLNTQVAFGALILTLCAVLNIITFRRIHQTQLSGKTIKIVERSMFAISLCIFVTQALNILMLLALYYFLLISVNLDVYRMLVSIMAFFSDGFSLGPGVYTLVFPGPIRRRCLSIIMPCRKKNDFHLNGDISNVQRISVQAAHTY